MLMRKKHALLKIVNNSLIDLPTPINISSWWNFGSLLGVCLITKIITGLFLATHYSNDISLAFNSVVHITRDVNTGWLIRSLHANGASMFFICLYLHIGRGIYYSSFKYMDTWNIGVLMLFMVMGVAFMGYVLPWKQMSFWGATVITNLLSAAPYLGVYLVQWLWSGFAMDNATLTRFFTFHFLMPFIVASLVMIHLLFLHQTESNNCMGLNANFNKITFHPFYSFKNLMGMTVMVWILFSLCLMYPYALGDVDNFNPANPLVTPIHIQPEWYFLFAYAILRFIPNKLKGVLCLFLSIAILFMMPFTNVTKMMSNKNLMINQFLFWAYFSVTLILTWIGANPIEDPYILVGRLMTMLYFFYFIINPITSMLVNSKIFTN